MAIKLVNNCTTQLIAGLAPGATVASVLSTLKMPVMAGGDYVYATLISLTGGFDNYGNPNVFEIVKIIGPLTPGAGSNITITRAQDSTNATQFSVGDVVDLRINRATLQDSASVAGALLVVNNLSDVANPVTSQTNLQFKSSKAASVARSSRDKMQDFVNVADFGAVGDGVTNDTPAIQAALNSLNIQGGSVYIPNTFRCLIDTQLLLPPNCSIIGSLSLQGFNAGTNAALATIGSTLIVNSAVSIVINGGSGGLRGVFIVRKGMTFPAADSSAYVGTAIIDTIGDSFVTECLIVGFATAYTNSGAGPRRRITNCVIDCLNGILMAGAAVDTSFIHMVDCWPIGTDGGGGGAAGSRRNGTAFSFANMSDGVIISQCSCYGYLVGYSFNNTVNAIATACRAETTAPPVAGSISFNIVGTSSGIALEGCTSFSYQQGINVNSTGTGLVASISDGWWLNSTQHSILVTAGNITVNQNVFNPISGDGIGTTSNTATIIVAGNFFIPTAVVPIFSSVATTLLQVRNDNVFNFVSITSSNIGPIVVASAATVALIPSAEVYSVSGTTNISALTGMHVGRRVTLIFQGILTVVNGVASTNIRLSGAVNFATTAGGTLTVICDGNRWYEIGRSA